MLISELMDKLTELLAEVGNVTVVVDSYPEDGHDYYTVSDVHAAKALPDRRRYKWQNTSSSRDPVVVRIG